MGSITFDTTDGLGLSQWAEQLGASVVQENDAYFCSMLSPGFTAQIAFRLFEDPTPGKNRIHPDMMPPGEGDPESLAKKLMTAGATLVDQQNVSGFTWG